MKICCLFNTPSLYREAIYKDIDSAYDCDWYFEDTDNKLAVFDVNELQRVQVLHASQVGPFYRVKGLVELIRRKEYTHYLMMGHTRNLSSLALLICCRLFYRKKKTFLWTHGYYGNESFFERVWKNLTLKAADGILLYSNYAKDLMLKAGFPAERLFVIHNSLNYKRQLEIRQNIEVSNLYQEHFGNENKNIVFIGRLIKDKKFHLLLEAISMLNSQNRYYNVTFIGDGEERKRMEAMIKEMGIEKQVWFYGACYDEQINANLVYNADLCVSPGKIGLTAIHVLMFGCPAITCDDFTVPAPEFEAISEGKTGAFFKADNSESLAETISLWFRTHQDDRDHVRQACYHEIDTQWTPDFQMEVIKSAFQ